MAAYSLRFTPNVFKAGARVSVRPEFFALTGQRCQLKLVEVDDDGLRPTDVATFSVTVVAGSGGARRFSAAARVGEAGTPPEGTPSFTLVFEGVAGEHQVAVDKPRDAKEGRFFELGLVVLDPSGKEVYPAGKPLPYARMDCGSVGSRYAKMNCKALNFSNDSAVVLPDGVWVLYGVLDYARSHRDGRLLVLSHTDSVGAAADNDRLSDDRARSVLHLMRGGHEGDYAANRAAFVARCKGRWATLDAQTILRWAATFSWAAGIDPGPPSSDRGAGRQAVPQATARALLEFDGLFKAKFAGAAEPAPPTAAQVAAVKTVPDAFWGQVFDVYQDFLMRLLGHQRRADMDKLVTGVRWLDAMSDATRSIGCGERYPLVAEQGGRGSVENRRTEFMFFVDGSERPASLARGDLGPLYDAAVWTVDEIPCPDDKPPPEITLPLPRTKDVLFVIDVSGSMQATDGLRALEENTRLSRVKRALRRLLGDLQAAHADALVNLIAYGGSSADPRAVELDRWRDALGPIDASTVTWIEGLRPRGSTPTGEAMLMALREAKGPGGAAPPAALTVVLLSDGAPNVRPGMTSEASRAAIIKEITDTRARLRPGWTIDTYGFAAADGQGFNDFMQKLAARNGGTFTAI
ncbi:MAG: VWA domain-containing protein [Planctomycetes bacterium]|nr:VWA domain-containing protein [Planctomycetota bacterium]